MKIKPHKWTKHHSHRVGHISSFIITIAILLTLGWTFGNSLVKINADTAHDVTIGVTVPGATPGPTTPTGPTGGSKPANQQSSPGQIYVSIAPSNSPDNKFTEITVNKDKKNQPEFVFDSPNPKFEGHTNIRSAVIHLEVHGSQVVSSNLVADYNGNWSWTPPVSLLSGEHLITVTATDPHFSGIFASNHIYIFVQTPASTGLSQPQTGYEQKTYPQISLTIVNNTKNIDPGEEIFTKINFFNFDLQGKDQSEKVRYVITDSSGNEIMNTSEIMTIGQSLSIQKSFYTNPGIESGIYTFTISVDANGATITASDTFAVSKLLAIGSVQNNFDWYLVVIILSLLILILLLIMLWELNKIKLLSWRINQLSHAK